MFESIIVELTSLCNMDCSFCNNGIIKREKMHMDYNRFTSIIDQIVEKRLAKTVELAAIGESLLYSKLFDAVAYCTMKRLKSCMHTNGILLTPECYRKLSENGLTNLSISLHNLTEKAFYYRHPKGNIDFKSYYKNIMDIIDLHVAMDSPIILTVCLLFSKKNWISTELWDLDGIREDTDNWEQLLQGFVRDMHEIACRRKVMLNLTLKNISKLLKKMDVFRSQNIMIMKNVSISLVPLNPQLFNTREKLCGEHGEKIKLVNRSRGSCSYLGRPMILSNGAFVPCAIEGLNELIVGRVDEVTSICDIVKGEKYQALIRGFNNRSIIHPVCKECRGTLRFRGAQRRFSYMLNPSTLYQRTVNFPLTAKEFLVNRVIPVKLKSFIKQKLYRSERTF